MSQPWLYSQVAHLSGFLIVGQDVWKSQSHIATSPVAVTDFMASCRSRCTMIIMENVIWDNSCILCYNHCH